MAYTSRHVTYHQSLQQGTTHNTSSSGAASSGKEATTKQSNFPSLAYVDIPHSQIRKVTASRLAFSKQTIPHYYLTVDPYVDKLMGFKMSGSIDLKRKRPMEEDYGKTPEEGYAQGEAAATERYRAILRLVRDEQTRRPKNSAKSSATLSPIRSLCSRRCSTRGPV
ncbi:hypothetical protein Bca52824_010853 [Brassica carinata]|uniref:2-oxoacid dehydrogenase acyltransferase catalytic domain-containing protein n=1 Tax=Brassica carinata TaxID=52824 RepID=A0A8X7WFX5_BRACI|nr:hypothetical protein Bca52824_010853 [Brassica carinata]